MEPSNGIWEQRNMVKWPNFDGNRGPKIMLGTVSIKNFIFILGQQGNNVIFSAKFSCIAFAITTGLQSMVHHG